ncbi:Zinc-type alcohol dehydrogenase [Hyphodiscus hymeniophilus]|uniref:Zinc-type alcohol dehydrogenase n=1 Tax=Hyphodiscus hymeniophilus TaxID=353542 RepID=A0A9P6VMC0_9HELO|nr:Zinc-type alcohol dehydrogenase [Hyphodiscus hymeniophilus]
MSTMKALRLTRQDASSPPVLSLETLPKPKLTPGHLLVKVLASAIHPSDIINSKGLFPYTTFPRVPGRDYAGTVVEGPEEWLGKEVYGTSGNTQAFTEDGAQAEFILVPESAVAPKPKGISFAQAACIGVPFTTAALTIQRANASAGDVVLVLGANGAVGSAAVQVAKSKGLNVLSATRADGDDVNTAKDPDLSAVDTLTASKGGVDVVVDTVGQPALTKAAISKLGRGGRLAFIAAPRTGAADLAFDMTDFYRKEKTLVGCNTLLYSVKEFAELMKEMTASFEKGDLRPAAEGEWSQVKLENGVEAYEKAKQRGAKVVIVMK